MARRNCCTIRVLFITTLALLAVLAGVLILSFVGIPRIISSQLSKSVRLEEGTDQWDRFVELPIELVLKVFIFHVKNAPEVLGNGAIPDLQEVGPYVYKEHLRKNITTIDEEEDSVSYIQQLNMTFDQELSGSLTEDDLVTIINPALLVLTQITSPIDQLAALGCLDKIFEPQYNQMFITVPVKTALIDGFKFAVDSDDVGPACEIVRQLVLEQTKVMKNIERIPNRETNDTDNASELRFSFLHFKMRENGVFTTMRGINDLSELGSIVRFNNKDMLPQWGNNETCKRVRGTDSTIYPPDVQESQTVEIFSTDICRVVGISYHGTGTYKGISGYRFGTDSNTLSSSTPDPNDDCYCSNQTLDATGEPSCYLDGIVDVMPCFGAPVLLSFPHFLYAEEYLNGVHGVDPPNASIHEIYLLVEPNTGSPLEGKKRVQLNVVIRPVEYMPFTVNLTRTVLPMLWIEEGASLTQELIDELNDQYFNKVNLANGLKYGFIALTSACVVVSLGFLLRKTFITKK